MLAGRHYHIIALAFAKQEVLAEEKIGQPTARGIGLPFGLRQMVWNSRS